MASLLDSLKKKAFQLADNSILTAPFKAGLQAGTAIQNRVQSQGGWGAAAQRVKDTPLDRWLPFREMGDRTVASGEALGLPDELTYGLRGATDFTSYGNQNSNFTPEQQNYRRIGRSATGYLATLPLGGVAGSAAALGTGTVLGGISGAVDPMIQGRTPTPDEIFSGAANGAESAWLFPVTSRITGSILNRIGAKALTQPALATGNTTLSNMVSKGNGFTLPALKQLGSNMLRSSAANVLESPLESTVMAGMEKLNDPSLSYLDQLKSRLIPDAVGNAVIGAATSGASSAVPYIRKYPKVPGSIDFSAPVGGSSKKQKTIGEMQIESQNKKGLFLLSEHDAAMKSGDVVKAQESSL
jgi:hypothetical protein